MKKILVVGPSWVGDTVMAQSLFQIIKKQEPASQIDVLAPSWTKPLLDRMPEVHQSLLLPFKHGEWKFMERYRLGRSLKDQHYDQAIVLPNSLKSAFIPFFAGIPVRTGWRGECRYGLLNDVLVLDKAQYPLMVQRYVGLVWPNGVPTLKDCPSPKLTVSPASVDQALKKYGLSVPQKPLIALCPGAEFGPSKCWPAEYYAEIAREKLAAGFPVWLFGSPNDRIYGEKIDELTEHRCVNLIGKTKLDEAIDLLSLASVAVANDSGLMHVASALGVPVIAIYGSTSPDYAPPLTQQSVILSLSLPCKPCFKKICPLGHTRCLKDLSPAMVLEAMQSLCGF